MTFDADGWLFGAPRLLPLELEPPCEHPSYERCGDGTCSGCGALVAVLGEDGEDIAVAEAALAEAEKEGFDKLPALDEVARGLPQITITRKEDAA